MVTKAAVALVAMLGCASVAAQLSTQKVVPPKRQGWTLALENDLFGAKGKSDRWFTNGLHFGLSFEPGTEPGLLRPLRSGGSWLLPPRIAVTMTTAALR